MDIFFWAILTIIGLHGLNTRAQARRVSLLGHHLGQFEIEKLMETLSDGYLRALGEPNPERRAQIWQVLTTTEDTLCVQFSGFARAFSSVPQEQALVSRLALALPFASQLFPAATFDAREVFKLHAEGLLTAARNASGRTAKVKAFTMTAEMLLMQHTCHWFCKSKAVASARMRVRHKTTYQQLIDSVAPETRKAYLTLTAG